MVCNVLCWMVGLFNVHMFYTCSPRICAGFLQLLWFPRTLQRRVVYVLVSQAYINTAMKLL